MIREKKVVSVGPSYIPKRITELRLSRGISEYQLSLELGQSRGYIQGISSGKNMPSVRQLFNIADYFGLSMAEFFGENLLGEDHVIVLETTESAPAVIASVIGMAEETVDAGTLATDLVDAGFDLTVAKAATKATNGLDRRGAARGGEMAKADTGYADLGL